MSAISAANYAKQGGAAAPGVNPALMGQAAAGQSASGAPSVTWDPRLSYPTMMYMNNLNAMNSMPNLLALQQQQRSMQSQQGGGGYMLGDPNGMLGGGMAGNQLGLDARKSRHIKSPTQLKTLKIFFQTNQRPTKEEIRKLVKETNLPHQEVTRWFRNERHKEKKSSEAKMEAIQGHVKMQGHPGMHQQQHGHNQHMQHQQQHGMKMKRKREDGSDGESDTGSEGEHHGRMSGFGLGNVNPPQRVAFIQSFIASLSDPTELEAAEKTLEAKRAALGIQANSNDGQNTPLVTDAAWVVLQQQFHTAHLKGEDAKRRKLGGKDAQGAAAAASSVNSMINGMDASMISGLTQMFAKHPEYLKEVQKNLGQ